MPFVEKKLDEFFTAENAESAEKNHHGGTRIFTEKILVNTTKSTKGTKSKEKRFNRRHTQTSADWLDHLEAEERVVGG